MAQKELKVRILGARGKIEPQAPGYRNHAGVLINDTLLFDVGEPEYLSYKPKLIFVTHLHSDHAFFVERPAPISVPVYTPEPHPQTQVIAEPVHYKNYKVTPIPVIHSNNVTSVAYLVEYMGKKILYTGDVASIEPRYLQKLPQLDAVITEGSFVRKGGLILHDAAGRPYGHNGIPDLIEMFRPYTNQTILTHFGSWFVKDPRAGAVRIQALTPPGMQIEIAHDGELFTL